MKSSKNIRLVILFIMVFGCCAFAADGSAETASSKSFFDQFVKSGGIIVWLFLLPMSVMTIYLAINYTITITRKKLVPAKSANRLNSIITRNGLNGLVSQIEDEKNMVSIAVSRAMTQAGNERRKGYYRVLVAESLQEQALELIRKIDWLSIIGNVAPMIGLFGTVFGMIKAFNGIVIAGGQPRPDQLAGGISLALVTTFWGLLVAIPALAIHGVFRNKIEAISSEAAMECESVLNMIDAQLDDAETKEVMA